MHEQGHVVIQFGEYLDTYGERKLDIITRCSMISPSFVKWSISCHLLIGSDHWFIPTVVHERFINDVRQRVCPWFHHQWPAEGWITIIAYLLWWFHALHSIWESLGLLDLRPSLRNNILHHLRPLHPLQFGKSDLWEAEISKSGPNYHSVVPILSHHDSLLCTSKLVVGCGGVVKLTLLLVLMCHSNISPLRRRTV